MRAGRVGTLALCSGICVAACGGGNSPPPSATPGADRSAATAALETAADVVQDKAPIDKISIYLDGFHAAKDEPQMQMEAHHYCNQMNEDVAQCVLFDGNTADARLNGVEYIISAAVYAKLPADEKAYWHPHNYEILSGALRMPGVPGTAEIEALERKMNSYGKTWHFWVTGVHGRSANALPLGPPHLAWSFNRDGETDPTLLESRDRRMNFDTAQARRDRARLAALAQPQGGVDALAEHFPGAQPMAGISDNGDAAARPVPTMGLHQPGATGR